MTSDRVPEDIRQLRPGPCTEVKPINGHYYVYMYASVQLASGKWSSKTGKCIGSITRENGFVPNRNFHLYTDEEPVDEITILEYGQYALIGAVAGDVRSQLAKHFPLSRAHQIFAYASILYANGFIHLDQVQSHFEQSWLSREYKGSDFKTGKTALGNLLDDLGRRTKRVVSYENDAILSSSAIAIDGHAIRSCSDENDLAEAGYKFRSLNEDQVNLLMGYDIGSGSPLFAKVYRGSCNDKSTIADLTGLLRFSGILFVIDRGFYSAKNLAAFSSDDNAYIIPVPSNTGTFKDAMASLRYTDSFFYRSGKKHARVEYMSRRLSSEECVYVFRDVDENERCRYNYQRCMGLGRAGYTQEGFEQAKEFFGVYVLQSNGAMGAEEVFAWYKKRWGIETLFQYMKNQGGYNDLMLQDYYKEQGMAFIMLVVGQIHQKMISAVKSLENNTISVNDILLMARFLKMELRGKSWNLKNTRKKELQILKKVGFEPAFTVPD